LYLGGVGVIWALSRLGLSVDLRGALALALERYRAAPDFDEDQLVNSCLDRSSTRSRRFGCLLLAGALLTQPEPPSPGNVA